MLAPEPDHLRDVIEDRCEALCTVRSDLAMIRQELVWINGLIEDGEATLANDRTAEERGYAPGIEQAQRTLHHMELNPAARAETLELREAIGLLKDGYRRDIADDAWQRQSLDALVRHARPRLEERIARLERREAALLAGNQKEMEGRR
jgi:hypothetical protein